MKHTPTPWNADGATTLWLNPSAADDFIATIIQSADGGIVAYVPHDRDHEENAALFAAAPDVRKALQRAMSWLSSYPGGGAAGAWIEAHEALKKSGDDR
jgi:hypothetical protein